VFADFFEKQNDRIIAGNISAPAIELHLDTVGLINACIDIDTQMPSYPEVAFHNTYGIEAINQTQYDSAVALTANCRNMSDICRSMADEQDPQGLGNNAEVNKACLEAYLYCFSKMHDGYDNKVRSHDARHLETIADLELLARPFRHYRFCSRFIPSQVGRRVSQYCRDPAGTGCAPQLYRKLGHCCIRYALSRYILTSESGAANSDSQVTT
jgi:hypothetical protein